MQIPQFFQFFLSQFFFSTLFQFFILATHTIIVQFFSLLSSEYPTSFPLHDFFFLFLLANQIMAKAKTTI